MSEYTIPCKAIVSYSEHEWRIEDVLLREPEQGEVLVQTIATGICHTDVKNVGGIYPRILGHEGAGVVSKVHESVKTCHAGDPVILSFPRCGQCKMCHTGNPAHCNINSPLTIFAREPNYALAHHEDSRLAPDSSGRHRIIAASYFGQSSFASISLCKESSIVKANTLIYNPDELKLFAPLGCGMQTGACSVTNVAKATEQDSVAVIGMGAVGLSSLLAAKNSGVKNLIAIDVTQSRLDLAREMGATHTVNSTALGDKTLSSVIQNLPIYSGTGTKTEITSPLPTGPSIIVDTTGLSHIMREALNAVEQLGTIIQLTHRGPGSSITIDLPEHMRKGARFVGTIQGNADPVQSIPMLVGWYREGKFPLERMEKTFQVEEWETALKELESGQTVKAVLVW